MAAAPIPTISFVFFIGSLTCYTLHGKCNELVTVNIVLYDRVEMAPTSPTIQVYFALAAMEAVSYFGVSISKLSPSRCNTHKIHLVELHLKVATFTGKTSTRSPLNVLSTLSVFQFIVYGAVDHNIIAIFAK